MPDGYAFTLYKAGRGTDALDSDVFPSTGQTDCWDLESDGYGTVVWNAGITPLSSEVVTSSSPTKKPTVRPTTPKPSSSSTSGSTARPTVASTTAQETCTSLQPAGTDTASPGTGLIGGFAFLDSDNDGSRDEDEPAVTDINVRLYSCAPPSAMTEHLKRDANDVLLAMDRTDVNGFYSFQNLASGFYRVNIQPPSGYAFSSAWIGSTDEQGELTNANADSTIDPATGSTPCFELMDGGELISWSFGMRESASSTSKPTVAATPQPSQMPGSLPQTPSKLGSVVISGFVFQDLNNNGKFNQGQGEGAVPNVQIGLFFL